MKTIYLKDGRMADLVAESKKGYLVDPYITWNGPDDEPDSAPSGNIEIVAEVFDTAPIDLIEANYKVILDKRDAANAEFITTQTELLKMRNEISSLKRQKTDIEKFIVNKSEIFNAKRIVVFIKDQIEPCIMDINNSLKITISYEIRQYANELRSWVYRVYKDESYSSGDYFDEKYGFLTDLTDDEILEKTISRLNSREWDDYRIKTTDNKWLTPEFVEKKAAIKQKEAEQKVESIKRDLKKLEAELLSLQPQSDLITA